MTYQVAFAISLIDEVTSVSSAAVAKCILGPLHVIAIIVAHKLHQEADVDIVRRQTRRRAKGVLERQHEFFEAIPLVRYDVADATERLAARHNVDGHDDGIF